MYLQNIYVLIYSNYRHIKYFADNKIKLEKQIGIRNYLNIE